MSPEWAARLRLAARIGIGPPDFWRLSVAEWRALTAPGPDMTMSRTAFAALAEQFPDERVGGSDD